MGEDRVSRRRRSLAVNEQLWQLCGTDGLQGPPQAQPSPVQRFALFQLCSNLATQPPILLTCADARSACRLLARAGRSAQGLLCCASGGTVQLVSAVCTLLG